MPDPAAPQPVAFVAGATGLVGRHLVEALARRSVAVVAHVRPDSARLSQWTQRFDALGATVDATPWQLADVTASLARQRVTHVFCCIGTTAARAKQAGHAALAEYEAVDFGLARLLAGACAATGGVERFVYLSSIGASPDARGAYLQVRWKAEQAVRKAGVAFTIARPSFIVGERDDSRPGEKVGAAIADAGLDLLGALGGVGLRARFHSHDPASLAEALARLAFDRAATGRTVEAAGLRG
ncbi:MAG: NAD-dependent epimerase/dehydratase family protein [Myxococcales bacterium]|nr:NAD-dependent epimerase/dehydratase family protein [Myxococcales bacterium]